LVAPSRAIGVRSLIGSTPVLDFSCGAMLSVVTVGISSRDHLGAQERAGARAIFDHDGFAQLRLQLLADHAAERVGNGAGGIGNDDLDRKRRIICGCILGLRAAIPGEAGTDHHRAGCRQHSNRQAPAHGSSVLRCA
jgi:hypothetical protein